MVLRTHSFVQSRFRPAESLTLLMAILLNELMLLRSNLSATRLFLVLNLATIAVVISMAHIGNDKRSRWLRILHDWYVLVIMVVIFFECLHLVPLINPWDRDNWLIAADLWLFGGHAPTVLLEAISEPWFTGLLQWVYASFYFLPFILCLRCYLKKDFDLFHRLAVTYALGFYLSYLGYFLVPAIGPRFTMVHLQTLPLTGHLGFETVRNALGYLEGVRRDCFPSGHTLISALTAVLCLRHDKKFAPVALPWACLLIFSCVYLRYHYVADVIAGLLLVPPVYIFHRAISSSANIRSRRRFLVFNE